MCEYYHIKCSPLTIAKAYENILANNVYVFEDTRPFLEWAKQHAKLGIISNGVARIQRSKLEKADLLKHFDCLSLSEETGFQKPSPEIFEIVLQQLGYLPAQVLMIGDSVESDLLGARNANIDFCWLNRRKQTFNQEYPKPTFQAYDLLELQKQLENK